MNYIIEVPRQCAIAFSSSFVLFQEPHPHITLQNHDASITKNKTATKNQNKKRMTQMGKSHTLTKAKIFTS